MDLHEDARSQQDDLAQLRRELHREPEIGLDLPRTQERVLRELDGLGLEISTGTDTTSVTAVLRGEGAARDSAQPRTVLLRADMDALPVQEATGLDFAAANGAMHACGHDLHTTSLVGAARLLHTHRDRINGDVVLMFQPGEEGWDGAGVMLKEGVLDAAGQRVDTAYGLHVFSSMLPSGQFASRPGTLMSASHKLLVTVHGEGGHGSMPHRAKDPISAAAAMITALQTMITRRLDIFDPAVLTVGVIRGGTKRNVIPATAEFEATVRCFSDDTAALLDTTIRETIDGAARANGVTADVVFENEYPVTVTDADETAFGAEVVRETIGEQYYTDLPNPVAGSEDFSRVLAAVPGTFLGLGALMPGLEPHTAPNNHSPYADFDPSVLSRAATVYAELAVRRLDRFAEGALR
ncbi:amidohydrolase [Amycolatopsis rubida]|uniref:Amidohydrolase n=1 Tax=Amycolatopsis rubida TaxID=112413 RepID=A0A1I5N636_9PSEU|nr:MULTISPECIES: M20 family metallopeptidase [Amycolatopsis]MYW92806.1 amidohydrolase [Amycolatopsis rubida]NEC57792.1 amidohydrolase [Amycolatopsis rubida]OAP21270.1 putative hydrolase YxeP [Amycolatopsis sp. M39]SFP16776.1 hippurate hydrolase [Amycolatopsis rubida]